MWSYSEASILASLPLFAVAMLIDFEVFAVPRTTIYLLPLIPFVTFLFSRGKY